MLLVRNRWFLRDSESKIDSNYDIHMDIGSDSDIDFDTTVTVTNIENNCNYYVAKQDKFNSLEIAQCCWFKIDGFCVQPGMKNLV